MNTAETRLMSWGYENSPPVRVAIADDEPLACEFLRLLVSRCPGYQVHWICNDGPSTVDAALNDPPDVLLLDIRMPSMSGLEVARHLKEVGRGISVILVTAYEDFEYARTAIHVGACDYLVKPVDLESLSAALGRSACSGMSPILRAVARVSEQASNEQAFLRSILDELCCWVSQETPGLFLICFQPAALPGNAGHLLRHLPAGCQPVNALWRMLLAKTRMPLYISSATRTPSASGDPWHPLLSKALAAGSTYIGLAAGAMAQCAHPLILSEVSKKVCVSSEHLSRLFPRFTGETFSEFYLRFRLESAFNDLQTSSETITEIAGRYGFSYSHHFSRAFRRYLGLTPTELRS